MKKAFFCMLVAYMTISLCMPSFAEETVTEAFLQAEGENNAGSPEDMKVDQTYMLGETASVTPVLAFVDQDPASHQIDCPAAEEGSQMACLILDVYNAGAETIGVGWNNATQGRVVCADGTEYKCTDHRVQESGGKWYQHGHSYIEPQAHENDIFYASIPDDAANGEDTLKIELDWVLNEQDYHMVYYFRKGAEPAEQAPEALAESAPETEAPTEMAPEAEAQAESPETEVQAESAESAENAPEQESPTEVTAAPEEEPSTEIMAAQEQELLTEVTAVSEQDTPMEAAPAPEQVAQTEAAAAPVQETQTGVTADNPEGNVQPSVAITATDLASYLGGSFDFLIMGIPGLYQTQNDADGEKWGNEYMSVTGLNHEHIVRARLNENAVDYQVFGISPGMHSDAVPYILSATGFSYMTESDGWFIYANSNGNMVAFETNESGFVTQIYCAQEGFLPISY